MEKTADVLKSKVREILGDIPSKIFLSRLDKTLDEGSTDKESLLSAAARVERMVSLFISTSLAEKVGCCCKETIEELH